MLRLLPLILIAACAIKSVGFGDKHVGGDVYASKRIDGNLL